MTIGVSDGRRGAPIYMAPEIFLGLTKEYTNSVDTFSAGVMLYEALYG